jgi:hypothetical protein
MAVICLQIDEITATPAIQTGADVDADVDVVAIARSSLRRTNRSTRERADFAAPAAG